MFSLDLWKQARKQLFPLIFSIVIGGAIGVLIVSQAWLLSDIISGVFLGGWGVAENLSNLILLGAVILIRAGLVYAREISAGLVSIRVRKELRQQLFSHLLDMSPVHVQQERTGEISNTLVQGIDRLDAYFRVSLPQLSIAVIVPSIILFVVFPLDWLTGTIFLVTAPLIPLFMVLIGKEAESRTDRQWRLLGRLSSHFLDVLQGLRTLKAFGISKRQGEVIQTVSRDYARITLGVLRIAFLSALVLELLATISTAIVAVQIGLRLLNGQISFFESLFVLILAPEFYFPLRQLGAAFHSGMEGIAAAERVFDLLNNKSQLRTGGQHPVPLLQIGEEIRFENVFFAYQSGERPSLKGVDLSIPMVHHTAIVGRSGAGKSTLFALLLGFLKPDSGEIIVGSSPLSKIDLAAWQGEIGWVPQFPHLFQGSIFENIQIARPNASEKAVISAMKRANLQGFVETLPDGFGTLIGERGARLSGGQAQRIAIARAFLRDSPILLLDEPATSLDTDSLEAIHQSIDALKKDRTVITISHQLSRVKMADKIVVMDAGRVCQSGRHDDLRAEAGMYASLLKAGGTLP